MSKHNEHILLLNAALVQVIDAIAKLESASNNVIAVLAALGIGHPCVEKISVAHGCAKIAQVQLDDLCKRFPR